jgi:hypothetical protein
MTERDLDVAFIVEVMNRHGVNYIVIDGVAAQAWATSVGVDVQQTVDIDLTPATDPENLDRLSAALDELGARVRTDTEAYGLPFAHDGASLARASTWNLICDAGPVDLSLIPSGTNGYEDLVRRARVVVLDGLDVPLADLADVIRSKRAAARAKDFETLPALEEALRRRDALSGDM